MSGIVNKVYDILSKNIYESSNGVVLTIRVDTNSDEDYLTIEGDELIFKTKTSGEKGRENAALVRFLSKELKISVSKIDIIYGDRSSLKKVLFMDIGSETLINRLIRVLRLI
ncbi:MAG: DUF167 domain-containing protein [Desulfurococcaceae archaeon]